MAETFLTEMVHQGLMKITQKTATYNQEVGDRSFSSVTHDTAKDLSALNRKHIGQTSNKGVPYLYTLAVTTYPALFKDEPPAPSNVNTTQYLFDGIGQENAMVTSVFYGSPNTWVQRNGAVKTHAAREQMFRDSEVTKEERGAYDATIHYKLQNGTPNSRPLLGVLQSGGADGEVWEADEIDGGRAENDPVGVSPWEYSRLIFPDDPGGALLHLCGPHLSEESTTAFAALCMPQLYLSSRGEPLHDSNEFDEDTPMKFSVLNKMLTSNYKGIMDEIVVLARSESDTPPYDLKDLTNDQFYCQEIGRSQFTAGAGNSATTIIEAPFGLFEMQSLISNVDILGEGTTGTINYTVELLGITEM